MLGGEVLERILDHLLVFAGEYDLVCFPAPHVPALATAPSVSRVSSVALTPAIALELAKMVSVISRRNSI